MKSLDKNRIALITAIVAEPEFAGITAGLLEKDEHLTDALKVIFEQNFDHAKLIFCGGTSLSKGHALIERMSEDADIKIVLSDEANGWASNRQRNYLGQVVREGISKSLLAIGLKEDASERRSQNGNRYMHSQWTYERAFGEVAGLRPNLQIELTVRTPVLKTENLTMESLSNRLTKRSGGKFNAETVSIAETQAEKVLSFLRRFGQHRAGQMTREWDTALVRHIYDVHCIVSLHPELLELSASAFSSLVEGDRAELGKQHPDYMDDPKGVLENALAQMRSDVQTQSEYDNNLLPLIYGDFRPTFDDSFASFERAAKTLLGTIS